MVNQHFNTRYDFLFVGKDEGSFVENYAYDLGEGGEQGGKVFISLEISQNNQDPDRIGEIIFDSLRRIFFADSEVDGYERFEASLKHVNNALREYQKERGSEWLGKLNVIIAAIVGNQLYLTQSGEAEAYLVRKRFVTPISDDLFEADSKDVFTNIASGDLESGDFILISTTRLLRYVSKNDLARHIGGGLEHSVIAIREFLRGEVISKVGLIAIEGSFPSSATDVSLGSESVLHSKEERYMESKDVDANASKYSLGKKINLNSIKGFLKSSMSSVRRKMNDISGNGRQGHGERRGRSINPWSFSNWGKDKILVAIIVLVFVLTIGVWWLRSKADEDARIQMLANDLVQIREQINSAVTTGQFDKDRAGEMLNNAEQKAITVLNSGYHKDKARELLDTILDTRDKMDGVMHPEMQKMADLSEKRSNVNALGLVKLKDKLYAYEYNALYPVALDRVEDPLTIDDNESVVSAINYNDRGSILFFMASGKIKEYLDDRMSFLQTTDSAFKTGKVLQAYSNKIYILDTEKNQIWRYTRRRDKFDAAQPYLNGVDVSGVVDLAIDGNIYALGADGYITKLFQGNKQEFPIKKQPVKALVKPTKIFTEADMNQIFILEPSERRVLVYNKDERNGGAIYTGQYIFDDLDNIKDFYVDKNTNTMYVLTSNAIYRTAL